MQLGFAAPLTGASLREHRDLVPSLVEAGFSEAWAGEVNGLDAFATLSFIASLADGLTLTASVVNPFTRGPALLAMSAAALGEIAPGRARFGLGSSSEAIVAGWNGLRFDKPYTHVRETLSFLRAVLRDGRTAQRYPTLGVDRFRLTRQPSSPPDLVLAALGPKMQTLAVEEADGIVLNFVSPEDLATIRGNLDSRRAELEQDPLTVMAGVFVAPSMTSQESAEALARRHLATYLNVPAYAAFQKRLGRGPELSSFWDRWEAGDRHAAEGQLPQDVIDQLIVVGGPEDCARRLLEYVEAGLDACAVTLLSATDEGMDPSRQADFLDGLARTFTRLERQEEAT